MPGRNHTPGVRPGVARLFRLAARSADRVRADADDEIRLHLELRVRQLVKEGLSPAEARAEAERRFGPIDQTRERLHRSAARREKRIRMREWLGTVRQDLKITLRGMRRTPGFVITVVVCLALGIGANSATFSLVDQLLLRPLPVAAPDRLVNLSAPGPKPGRDNSSLAGPTSDLFSYPMFRDLARSATALGGIAAFRLVPVSVALADRTRFGQGAIVSGSYFPLLGLKPALGRLFGPQDDQALGAHPVAVLAYDYWTNELGSDPAAVGRAMRVNGALLTVIGVAPRGFGGTTVGVRPVVYVPLSMAVGVDPAIDPANPDIESRRYYWLYLFGRLRPRISTARASDELNRIYHSVITEVEAPLQHGMSAATMAHFRERRIILEDGRRGQSVLHGQTRQPMLLLFGITALVTLIACANIANLLLARGAARAGEMAVRLSLGAGRRRLIAQLLTESMLLALLGGAASLLVAAGTLRLIASLVPSSDLGNGATLTFGLQTPVMIFTALASLGTGLLFGLFPALHGTRSDLLTAIRGSSGQPSGARGAARFRRGLVTAQIALSMSLLVAAGLFVGSLRNIARIDLGIDVERLVTFGLAPGFGGYGLEQTQTVFEEVERRLGEVAGVTGVTASTVPLLSGSTNGGNVRVEGFARGPDTDANTRRDAVDDGFFDVMHIPLLAGRGFTDRDRPGSPLVAVVNESFARKFGLGRDAVGRRMAFGNATDGPLDVEIVGLVSDMHYSGVRDGEPPLVFTPYQQDPPGALIFYVRTARASEAIISEIRGLVRSIDPELPLIGLKTMPEQVHDNVYVDRLVGLLSTAFAVIATLLAAVGLYGVLTYTVARRTREFGLRMALGADAGHVRGLVLRQVGHMTLVGGALGVAGALALGHAAQSLLYELDATDPAIYGAAAAVLGLVTIVTGWLPAWRASRLEPMEALRVE
jgi:predicted permease